MAVDPRLGVLERRSWQAEQNAVWRRRVRALAAMYDAADACSAAGLDCWPGPSVFIEAEAAVLAGPRPWPGSPPPA